MHGGVGVSPIRQPQAFVPRELHDDARMDLRPLQLADERPAKRVDADRPAERIDHGNARL
jgi:hypothetical protein